MPGWGERLLSANTDHLEEKPSSSILNSQTEPLLPQREFSFVGSAPPTHTFQHAVLKQILSCRDAINKNEVSAFHYQLLMHGDVDDVLLISFPKQEPASDTRGPSAESTLLLLLKLEMKSGECGCCSAACLSFLTSSDKEPRF